MRIGISILLCLTALGILLGLPWYYPMLGLVGLALVLLRADWHSTAANEASAQETPFEPIAEAVAIAHEAVQPNPDKHTKFEVSLIAMQTISGINVVLGLMSNVRLEPDGVRAFYWRDTTTNAVSLIISQQVDGSVEVKMSTQVPREQANLIASWCSLQEIPLLPIRHAS